MKRQKEKGSITVETVICLTLFVFFFVVILNFINIAYVQIRVQHALANSSYEISVYSYAGAKAKEKGGTVNGTDYVLTVLDKYGDGKSITLSVQDQTVRNQILLLGENPAMFQSIVKSVMDENLMQYINGKTYLSHLGVVDGIDGMHYELSEYNPEEGYVRVSVYYKYRIIGFPFLNAGIDVNIFQNSTSVLWR